MKTLSNTEAELKIVLLIKKAMLITRTWVKRAWSNYRKKILKRVAAAEKMKNRQNNGKCKAFCATRKRSKFKYN